MHVHNPFFSLDASQPFLKSSCMATNCFSTFFTQSMVALSTWLAALLPSPEPFPPFLPLPLPLCSCRLAALIPLAAELHQIAKPLAKPKNAAPRTLR